MENIFKSHHICITYNFALFYGTLMEIGWKFPKGLAKWNQKLIIQSIDEKSMGLIQSKNRPSLPIENSKLFQRYQEYHEFANKILNTFRNQYFIFGKFILMAFCSGKKVLKILQVFPCSSWLIFNFFSSKIAASGSIWIEIIMKTA